MNQKVAHLEGTLKQAEYQVNIHPKQKFEITKFLSVYMPMMIQLLSEYIKINQQYIKREDNIQIKNSIEKSVDMMLSALEKQLENIQKIDILNIITDSEAIQNTLMLNGYVEPEVPFVYTEK